MFRPKHFRTAATQSRYRQQGLEDKISIDSDLRARFELVLEELTAHGNDSPTYLPDRHDPSVVRCVLQDYGLYTPETAKRLREELSPKFDDYYRTCEKEAKQFFIKSLEATLAGTIRTRCKLSEISMAELVIKVVQECTSTHHTKYELYKKQIRDSTPDSACGVSIHQRNVVDINAALKPRFEELEKAHQLEPHLLQKPLEIALECPGTTETPAIRLYKDPIGRKLGEVEAAVAATCTMSDNSDKMKYLADNKLMFEDIAEVTEGRYRIITELGEYPPASNPTDRRRPEANALRSNMTGPGEGSSRQGNCYNCGSKDHWASDCPKKGSGNDRRGGGGSGRQGNFGNHRNANSGQQSGSTTNGGGQGQNGSSRSAQGRSYGGRSGTRSHNNNTGSRSTRTGYGGGRNDRQNGRQQGNYSPPGINDAQTRMIRGIPHYWCSKCGDGAGRWTRSHLTNAHGVPNSRSPQANTALVLEPSAWSAEMPDLMTLFLPYMVLGIICLTAGACTTYWDMLSAAFIYGAQFVFANLLELTAPLLWIILLMYLIFKPTPEPEPLYNRKERRYLKEQEKKWRKKHGKVHPGSIKDHGLSRHYPRMLRSIGQYFCVTRPSKTAVDKLLGRIKGITRKLDRWIWRVVSMERKINLLMRERDKGWEPGNASRRLKRGSAGKASFVSRGIVLRPKGPRNLKPEDFGSNTWKLAKQKFPQCFSGKYPSKRFTVEWENEYDKSGWRPEFTGTARGSTLFSPVEHLGTTSCEGCTCKVKSKPHTCYVAHPQGPTREYTCKKGWPIKPELSPRTYIKQEKTVALSPHEDQGPRYHSRPQGQQVGRANCRDLPNLPNGGAECQGQHTRYQGQQNGEANCPNLPDLPNGGAECHGQANGGAQCSFQSFGGAGCSHSCEGPQDYQNGGALAALRQENVKEVGRPKGQSNGGAYSSGHRPDDVTSAPQGHQFGGEQHSGHANKWTDDSRRRGKRIATKKKGPYLSLIHI